MRFSVRRGRCRFCDTAATGDFDGGNTVAQPSEEVPVKEFRTVVAVNSAQGEGQALLHVLESFASGVLPFVPGGMLLGPTCAYVR